MEKDVVIYEIVRYYSNYPSILKIRDNFDNSQTVEQFQFNIVTTSEMYKLLKNIDNKKNISWHCKNCICFPYFQTIRW